MGEEVFRTPSDKVTSKDLTSTDHYHITPSVASSYVHSHDAPNATKGCPKIR